ncbi:MAG: LysM peptidoglycan-binding domain-containing protein [Gemmatimonadetes bacterium]|nr:LysM peptidoglycan-binding domain-containing protein [Gemmatimonadota bacterium]
MVRSAAAVLSVLILSGFAALQQVATHTVVGGDTLWDLAQRYYQDPFQWRRIWEANRTQVADPNLILPGWVLTIPDRSAEVADVTVEGPAAPPSPGEHVRGERTVFYEDTARVRAGVIRSGSAGYLAVSRDMVYGAPWLVPFGQEPPSLGTLEGFAGGGATTSVTARGWDRVHLVFDGEAPPLGTELLSFRVTKTIESVGQVATPTGVLTVSEARGREAVAVVTREFDRVMLGDALAPVPVYALRVGQYAEDVASGAEAMIMGFAGWAELQDLGSVAFLDQGADDGVAVGDEFEYVNRLAGSDVVEGRLQVVGVTANVAAARIMAMDDAVFRQGLVVRLARKMR